MLGLVPLRRGGVRYYTSVDVDFPHRMVIDRNRVSAKYLPLTSLGSKQQNIICSGDLPGIDFHGRPYVVRVRATLRVPCIAHVNVSGRLRTRDCQFERVLGTVGILCLGRDVRSTSPGTVNRRRPEDLVRVGAPASLSRHDEEVNTISLHYTRGLVRASRYRICLVFWPSLRGLCEEHTQT